MEAKECGVTEHMSKSSGRVRKRINGQSQKTEQDNERVRIEIQGQVKAK
jgi:hypothetical protein